MAQILYAEFGQDVLAQELMTDSGDHIDFNCSETILSAYKDDDNNIDRSPVVRPNGVLSGGNVTAATTNDDVDISALYCFLEGTWYGESGGTAAVSAATGVAITRGTASNPYRINSITLASNGAFAVVTGTAHTAFSETRGASGGPPLIPVKSIELAQVRTSSATAGALDDDEIKDVPGLHRELAMYPNYTIKYARVSSGVLGYAGVTFTSALPLIHTGSTAKHVYISGYTPSFAEFPDSRNVKPPEETGSASTETYYGRSISAVDKSLNSGSFEYAVQDGVTDSTNALIGKEIWWKYKPSKTGAAYALFRGYFFRDVTYNATGVINASATLISKEKSMNVIS